MEHHFETALNSTTWGCRTGRGFQDFLTIRCGDCKASYSEPYNRRNAKEAFKYIYEWREKHVC